MVIAGILIQIFTSHESCSEVCSPVADCCNHCNDVMTGAAFLYALRYCQICEEFYRWVTRYLWQFIIGMVGPIMWEMKNYYLTVRGQRNILHEITKGKTNWIGNILRRNWQVIEGEMKGGIVVKGRRGRRRRKLLYELKERRGYAHRKEDVLDRTNWRARFGRGFGPVVIQTAEWINGLIGTR
jgi:hypothetical protein